MPFSEIELKLVEKTVGKMCGRRSPAHLHDQLRTTFEVKGHDVIVHEERPLWDNPQQWSSMPVAKFKYIRKDTVWKLYWMRSDMKWHSYEMPRGTKSLETLVKGWIAIRTEHSSADSLHNSGMHRIADKSCSQ